MKNKRGHSFMCLSRCAISFISMLQPNELDDGGNSAVFLAAEHGQFDVLVALLIFMQQGPPQLRNLNLPGSNAQTPLVVAAQQGHSDCVLAVCRHQVEPFFDRFVLFHVWLFCLLPYDHYYYYYYYYYYDYYNYYYDYYNYYYDDYYYY